MIPYICRTCGAQHAESEGPPDRCIICEDERQYVGRGGQQWTTLEQMQATGHKNVFHTVDPGVIGIHTYPQFAIGQRMLLICTEIGNFLWDMISFIDDETVSKIKEMGGVQGIAISHPHFYGVAVEYSRVFGALVYIPEADREWFVRPDTAVVWFNGAVSPWDGVSVIQVGGHFEGSTVVHWAEGADGRGALFTGDSIALAQDRRWVTFMRSYPNFIPLPEKTIWGIVDSVEPYEFDRIYGCWPGAEMRGGAKEAVRLSAERYIKWGKGEGNGGAA